MKRVDKRARARLTSVDEVVFGRDLDGDGCCEDLMAHGVHLAATIRAN